MVTEETAKRIAGALERLAVAVERAEKPPMLAYFTNHDMRDIRPAGIHHQQEPFDHQDAGKGGIR